ncbi:MAG: glycosyltransferase [Clostridia bacterium]|nr:glycosyltransferase [Clostridia bacterium]
MGSKTKIAFVLTWMSIGGQERALLEMLKHIDFNKIDVTLYLYDRGGGFENQVPSEVHLKTIPRVQFSSFFSHPICVVKRYVIGGLAIALGKCFHKNARNYKYFSNAFLPIKEKFDYVILYDSFFLTKIPFVLTKFKESKKVFWLHGEVKNHFINSDIIRHLYEFDKIFAVSSVVAKQLVDVRPELKDKTEVFYNYMDVKSIKEKSYNGESFQDHYNGQRILTVGRISAEKGQDLAVLACKKLIDAGYNIRWYACGAGDIFENIKQLIIDNNLENDFILMGAKENPYPYMKDCDLYVQPSKSESWGLSVQEALILGKPVIVTNVGGLHEVVEYGKNGYIVDKSVDAIYEKVKWCLDNPQQVQKLCENIKNIEFKQEDINRLFF